MKRKNHAGPRNPYRWWLVAAAFCVVPLAQAQSSNLPAQSAPYSAFEWMQRQTTGNTTQAGMNIGGARVAASPINGSGWQRAGNYGVNNQINPSGLTFGASLEIPNGGQRINAQWRGVATKAAVADGIGILFKNAAKLSGPLGVAVMLADFAGVFDPAGIAPNTNPATQAEKPFLLSMSGVWWRGSGQCLSMVPIDAIRCTIAHVNSISDSTLESCTMLQQTSQSASGRCIYKPTGGGLVAAVSATTGSGGSREANWDEVRPAFEAMNPLPSEVSQKMIEWARKQDGQNGIEPFKLMIDPLGLTGPSTFPPTTVEDKKTTTRTGADGRPETVETTTRKTTETGVTYDGDKVKVTPKETTTTTTKVTDADGNVKETTETDTKETTENTAPKEETPGLCDLYPDILACAKPELDAPEEEIPRTEKQITYEAEQVMGPGSCPADKVLSVRGQQITVWNWQESCSWITSYVKPVLIAMAGFCALIILMPSAGRESV
jgi:hypothetical protein